MSNLILSARESNKGISVICPHCKFGSRYSFSYIEDALNEKLRLTCCVCEEKFGLVVTPLDTITQPNTACTGQEPAAAVESQVACGSCQ